MIGILSQIQVRGSSKLFFNDKSLFQQFEPTCQELVLDLQEVAFAHIHLKRFIDDREPMVVLDILPTAITVSYNTWKIIKEWF